MKIVINLIFVFLLLLISNDFNDFGGYWLQDRATTEILVFLKLNAIEFVLLIIAFCIVNKNMLEKK